MDDEIYSDWKKRRADIGVPAGFADRVMEQVAARGMPEMTWTAWVGAQVLPRVARAAACLLAGLFGLARMAQAVGALIP